MNYKELTVIIPTLNEEKNIERLLEILTRLYKGAKVIVADDGSKDKTQQIVRGFRKKNSNVMLLDRTKEQTKGITASAIDAVKKTKTKYLTIIDGDLQHPPEKIRGIAEKLEKADLVIGTRKKVLVDWPWNRKLMSMVATNLARIRLLRLVKDPVSGFFGARTGLFRDVLSKRENRFEKKGYKVLFDLLKYVPRRTRIADVYYDFGLRTGGESKIGRKQAIIFFRSLFK